MSKVVSQGMTMQNVLDAVKKSGFPLQTLIANKLASNFRVQEEWPFTDSDSHEIRTIDILAQKEFWWEEKEQPHARPELNLLVECKKSESPYVFSIR